MSVKRSGDGRRLPATLNPVADRVQGTVDERGVNNGWWVYLMPGWIHDGTHQIHEDTLAGCLRCFDMVQPCDCDECKQLLDEMNLVKGGGR
jgi:hypothetical protein